MPLNAFCTKNMSMSLPGLFWNSDELTLPVGPLFAAGLTDVPASAKFGAGLRDGAENCDCELGDWAPIGDVGDVGMAPGIRGAEWALIGAACGDVFGESIP